MALSAEEYHAIHGFIVIAHHGEPYKDGDIIPVGDSWTKDSLSKMPWIVLEHVTAVEYFSQFDHRHYVMEGAEFVKIRVLD